MIIQLRRRHYYTWLSIAVLLPIGFVWAYLNVPKTASDSLAKTPVAAYPKRLKSVVTDALTANLRQNTSISDVGFRISDTATPTSDTQNPKYTEGSYQIELIVSQPLIGAANQLYVSTSPDKPLQTLLGALGNRGTYYFALPNSVTPETALTLTVFDAIKQKQAAQLVLK